MQRQPIELLAPAGSYQTFLAVLQAGADAVYLGGSRFGARAYADNFDEKELLSAIDYAHLHGRKVYLTVNTLLKEKELNRQLYDYLLPYYRQGLDAVIVQDLGAFSLIHREFPELSIHASTQMTVTGCHGAAYLKRLGARRIVTARELSLEEIRQIHETVDIEIVKGFLVTDNNGQPEQIDEIPVYSVEECPEDISGSLILIAVPAEYQDSIEQELIRRRLTNYRKLDARSEYELMGRYLKKVQGISLIEDYQTGSAAIRNEDASVYMAVSHKDKILSRIYDEKPWIKKIQAGAALADEQILELTDEGIDSLSAENNLYGELTAAYYAWKHNRKKITGLFHYRRILRITEEQLYLLKTGKIDVVLPLPFVCYPDASGQYGRYILPQDIAVMKRVLREFEKEDYEDLEAVLKTPYLYNYNMLIARKEVFDDYCSWLFPILRKITDGCEREKRERLPRYIGRIGEVLTSLYFMQDKKNWKVTHAEKVWRI